VEKRTDKKRNEMLDHVIALILSLSKEEERNVSERLRTRFDGEGILAKHGRLIGGRNAALPPSRAGKGYATSSISKEHLNIRSLTLPESLFGCV